MNLVGKLRAVLESSDGIPVKNVGDAVKALKSNRISVTSKKYTNGEAGFVSTADDRNAESVLKGLGLYGSPAPVKYTEKDLKKLEIRDDGFALYTLSDTIHLAGGSGATSFNAFKSFQFGNQYLFLKYGTAQNIVTGVDDIKSLTTWLKTSGFKVPKEMWDTFVSELVKYN